MNLKELLCENNFLKWLWHWYLSASCGWTSVFFSEPICQQNQVVAETLSHVFGSWILAVIPSNVYSKCTCVTATSRTSHTRFPMEKPHFCLEIMTSTNYWECIGSLLEIYHGRNAHNSVFAASSPSDFPVLAMFKSSAIDQQCGNIFHICDIQKSLARMSFKFKIFVQECSKRFGELCLCHEISHPVWLHTSRRWKRISMNREYYCPKQDLNTYPPVEKHPL